MNIAEKIAKVKELNLTKYTKRGVPHAEFAAAYATEDFINMAKQQPKHFEQLLDEEIEDLSRV